MQHPLVPVAILFAIIAVTGWLNLRTLRLPRPAALLAGGLAAAALLVAVDAAAPHFGAEEVTSRWLEHLDFGDAVLHVVLGYFLFAGGLRVDLQRLLQNLPIIVILASVGVALSAAVVLAGFYPAAAGLGLPVSLAWALVFALLISPTDPVAVLAAVKTTGLPRPLRTLMQGEALFNDGFAVVSVVAISGLLAGTGASETPLGVAGHVAVASTGAVALGAAGGWLTIGAMHSIDEYPVEIMITLALATSVYAIAEVIGVSGPLSAATAGLLVGGRHGERAMSEKTRERVREFWAVTDEILNAVLFVLIGLEVLVIPFQWGAWALAAIAVPLVLAGRAVGVSLPTLIAQRLGSRMNASLIPVAVWGGVRGGVSVALALSLPDSEARPVLLTVTYVVVIASILAQGLTLKPLVRRLHR